MDHLYSAHGGAVLAFTPGAHRIVLEPDLALALFLAPVLLDAAYDTVTSLVLIADTIRALEERVGLRLLTRTTRKASPTAAGERLRRRDLPRRAGGKGHDR